MRMWEGPTYLLDDQCHEGFDLKIISSTVSTSCCVQLLWGGMPFAVPYFQHSGQKTVKDSKATTRLWASRRITRSHECFLQFLHFNIK